MRRTATITIPAPAAPPPPKAGEEPEKVPENRDAGKSYLLTEMPSEQAERWAMRAMLAMVNNGAEIPADIASAGMAGLASLGPRAFTLMDFNTADLLMREMFECVQIVPASNVPRKLTGDDIEEVPTRLKLRLELFALHTGFSLAELQSKLNSARQQTGSLNT